MTKEVQEKLHRLATLIAEQATIVAQDQGCLLRKDDRERFFMGSYRANHDMLITTTWFSKLQGDVAGYNGTFVSHGMLVHVRSGEALISPDVVCLAEVLHVASDGACQIEVKTADDTARAAGWIPGTIYVVKTESLEGV